MNTDQDLRKIWLRQKTAALPAEKELLKRAGSVKRKARNMIVFTFVLLIATLAAISVIVYVAKPQMLSTKAGIAMVGIAILTYLAASGSLLQYLLRTDRQDASVKQYLDQLIAIRAKQRVMQNTILSAYFALLCTGIFLYMIEYVVKMSVTAGVVAYSLTALWFGLNWVYIRPRVIRKQSSRLNEIIRQLEKINEQY
jgi:competence protein ComGC